MSRPHDEEVQRQFFGGLTSWGITKERLWSTKEKFQRFLARPGQPALRGSGRLLVVKKIVRLCLNAER